MFFSSKPINFVKKTSIISRNQRSLFKLVEGLLVDGYHVMYARPAYHIFDVDVHNNSKANIRKGRDIVAHYLDIVIVEDDSLLPICAFRMDDNGSQPIESWSTETRALYEAAKSAGFPLIIVPDTKNYSTAMIVYSLKGVLPLTAISERYRTTSEIIHSIESHEESEAIKKADHEDVWSKSGFR